METEQQFYKSPPPGKALSVIIPAFNEGHHIHANILQVCETLHGLDFEVIVVDDGSLDNTFAESQRAAAAGYPVLAVHQPDNRGKGASLFHGFEFAVGEYIVFLDADLEIRPENIKIFLHQLKESDADLVIGTKVPKLGQMPFLRRIMSLVYREFVSLLFGLSLRETQTGIKLFRREVLEVCIPRLRVSRFAFDVELLVAASRFGYRIVEFPVEVSFSRQSSLQRIKTQADRRSIMGYASDLLHGKFLELVPARILDKDMDAGFRFRHFPAGNWCGKTDHAHHSGTFLKTSGLLFISAIPATHLTQYYFGHCRRRTDVCVIE